MSELDKEVETEVENEGATVVDDIDYEAEAVKMGWDESYSGPNKRSAKEFYERGMEIQPILKKNLERAQHDNDRLRAEVDSVRKESRKALKIFKDKAKKDYDRELDTLRSEKAAAVADADHDRYTALEKREDKLREDFQAQIAEEEEKAEPAIDPALSEWRETNKWFDEDMEMQHYANAYAGFISANKPHLKGKAFLDAVTQGVKERYPDHFNNPRRKTKSVDAPTAPSKQSGEKSFSDLPRDAKRAYQDLVGEGIEMTKEEYAKGYFDMEVDDE